jgi:hypothetical protein
MTHVIDISYLADIILNIDYRLNDLPQKKSKPSTDNPDSTAMTVT